MTVTFGLFSPFSGSATTTSTCYTLSCSASSTSTTNTYSSHINNVNIETYCSMMSEGGLETGSEYNAISSPGFQSRARCRSPQAQPSVTLPGVRGSTFRGAEGGGSGSQLPFNTQLQLQQSISLDPTSANKMPAWPECFQDLRSWCHPDRDELNTPQITMEDGFNFSPGGQTDIWSYIPSPSVEVNEVLINNQDLLVETIADEENNNYSIEGFSPCTEGDMSKSFNDNKVMELNGVPFDNLKPQSIALKGKGKDVLLSQTVLQDESPIALGTRPIKGEDFIEHMKLNSSQTATRLGNGGKLIQIKPDETCVPMSTVYQGQQQQQGLVQASETSQGKKRNRKARGHLKLNIPPTPPVPEPATTALTSTDITTLGTPDVYANIDGFNLLQYINAGLEEEKIKIEEFAPPQKDHDYMERGHEEVPYIKDEPMSPGGSALQEPFGNGKSRKRKHSTSRKREEEDYDSDPMGLNDDSESEEWYPGQELHVTRKGGATPARRGRKPSSVDSIGSDCFNDRYRELRDKNNEASRRSRQNRKQRDAEMRNHRADLERANTRLKLRATKMEKLVEEMRAILLKSIRNSRMNANT